MKFDTHVNIQLLSIKGHYLAHCGSLAPLLPFLSVLGRNKGFPATIVGFVYIIAPICGLLSKPLVGAIADKFQIMKSLFIAIEIITAVGLFPINYIPPLSSEAKVQTTCIDGKLQLDTTPKILVPIPKDLLKKLKDEKNEFSCQIDCPSRFNKKKVKVPSENVFIGNQTLYIPVNDVGCTDENLICDIVCDSNTINDYMDTREKNNVIDFFVYYQFWLYAILVVISWCGQCVIGSVGDALCYALIGDPHLYGQQRLWCSFGWGSVAVIGGLLVDTFSPDEYHKDYTVSFMIMIAFTALDVFCSAKMKYVKPQKSPSILKDIGKLLSNLRIFIFLLWVLTVGTCAALFWNFFFWLVEDLGKKNPETLPHLKTIEGLILAVRCFCGEIPLFYLSGYIIKRLGTVNCMSLILLLEGTKLLLYTIIPNPWLVIPVEIITGGNYGLFYSTMTSHASKVSPTGTEATVQGIVSSLFDGVGVALGSFIGGVLFSKFGGRIMFLTFGISALLICALHVIVQYLIKKFKMFPEIVDQPNQIPDETK